MASTSSLLTPSIPLFEPIPRMVEPINRRRKHTNLTTFATRREGHDQNFGAGRNIVDENMIVLRTRIHEMKMVERDNEPPVGWMDWEKDIYPSYDMIICDAMRFLQSYLMETRPSFALAMFGLIALSVPISTGVVIFNLLELSRGLLSAVHLSL